MDLGPLLSLWLQSFLIKFTMTALNIVIFVIVYGRLIEIYLLTSLASIPLCHGGKPENRQYGDTTPFQGFLKQYMAKAAELMGWNIVDVVPHCEQDEQKNNEGTNLSLVSQPLRLGFTFTSGLTFPSILPCSFSNA